MDKSSIQFKKTKWLDLAWYDILILRNFHIKKIMCGLLLQWEEVAIGFEFDLNSR